MTDKEKMGGLNASKQIKNGTVDETLLSKELLQRLTSMEERITDLEKQLGDTNVDFVATYDAAKNQSS